jgi:selenocysteine-specific elongation factor
MSEQSIRDNHVIIGTAGHIDHGKTALVKALTGIDADTLSEEKHRGITIELGFVFMETSVPDKQIVFIDVPGHEKLVKTMVAGASHIDAALLVIAADEGINVQTREHFEILQLLGIPKGLIALTKSDLVDKGRLKELETSVNHFINGTFLGGAPLIPVSSVSGAGIENLRTALLDIAQEVQARTDSGPFRMPVDRVFIMKGFGTVIAGTILSGEVKVGDRITIYPEGLVSRVRNIQVHHSTTGRSRIGKRTALNLPEIAKDKLYRGQTAAASGSLTPTKRLDGKLQLLKSYGKDLKNRERLRLHIGTAEIIGRLVLINRERLSPGETAFVQFVLESPTVALPQDRFVVRTFSPLMTIGGGIILDAQPQKHKRFSPETAQEMALLDGSFEDAVEQAFIKSLFTPLNTEDIAKSLGKEKDDVFKAVQSKLEAGKIIALDLAKTVEHKSYYLHKDAYTKLKSKFQDMVKSYFQKNPYELLAPMPVIRSEFMKLSTPAAFKSVLNNLIEENAIQDREGKIGLPEHRIRMTAREEDLAAKVEAVYKNSRFKTPIEEDVRAQLALSPSDFKNILSSLLNQGKLVRLSKNVIYHSEALTEVKGIVADHIDKKRSITIAELRDIMRFSRKYAQAILEFFDSTGLTKRQDDKHILA